MVLVPGPQILNGAIASLERASRWESEDWLAYAAVIVRPICAGGLFGFTAVGAKLAIAGSPPPVPLVIGASAVGCAVASFGTFFSMPWRLLTFRIAAGMLARAARSSRSLSEVLQPVRSSPACSPACLRRRSSIDSIFLSQLLPSPL